MEWNQIFPLPDIFVPLDAYIVILSEYLLRIRDKAINLCYNFLFRMGASNPMNYIDINFKLHHIYISSI